MVESAAGILRRHGLGFTKVHHVQAAWRDDGGHSGLRGCIQTLRAGIEHAAQQFIRPLRGRDVEHTGDHAAFDQRFHGPPAIAGGGKDQHFIARRLQQLFGLRDTGGRVAKHAGNDQRPVGNRTLLARLRRLHHAADGTRRVFKDHSRQAIDARHIDDGRDHDDVLGADIGRGVAAGQRADHDFRETHGQRPHRRRADGRATAAAERDHPLDAAALHQSAHMLRRRPGHQRHTLTAILPRQDRLPVLPAGCRHGSRTDVRCDGWLIETAHIDQQWLMAARSDAVREIGMFSSFGVQSSENGDGRHGMKWG